MEEASYNRLSSAFSFYHQSACDHLARLVWNEEREKQTEGLCTRVEIAEVLSEFFMWQVCDSGNVATTAQDGVQAENLPRALDE